MRWLMTLLLLLPVAALGAEPDFSVGWIGRTPRIDYVWDSPNPRVDGWPVEGADVQWVANVRWLGGDAIRSVSYRWLIDGTVVRTGTLDFGPESIVSTELPSKWTFARHEIVFEIDPNGRVAETEERNNRLLSAVLDHRRSSASASTKPPRRSSGTAPSRRWVAAPSSSSIRAARRWRRREMAAPSRPPASRPPSCARA